MHDVAYRVVGPAVDTDVLEHAFRALASGKARVSPLVAEPRLALLRGEATVVELGRGRTAIVPVVAGAALGSGAVYERNLPPPGTFVIDPVEFAIRTSKNRKSNPPVAHPGFASTWAQRIDAVGIVSKIYIMFEGTTTGVGGAATATRGFPWMLLRRLRLSANGINNLFACDGLDLRGLMRVRRPFWQDRTSQFVLNTGIGNVQPLRLIWEVPISYDESLVGAIFAQTEETYLNIEVDTAAAADIYAANVPTVTAATWRVLVEFFSIPIVDSKAGRKLVLPDITQLHGVVSRDDNLTAVGDHIAPLTRTGGILLRVMQRGDNAAPNFGNLDVPADVDSHAFRYGGNVVPISYTPSELLMWQNQLDYGDQIQPAADVVAGAAPPQYMVDDFVKASAVRDAVHMLGITEAQMVNTIRGGAVINAGATVHTVQEAMVAS